MATSTIAETWFQQLSLEQKVGQLLVPRPETLDLPPTHYVDALQVGGIIVHREIYRSPAQLAGYVAEAQQAALAKIGVPLFITCDQEGGHTRFTRSAATDVPSNMALGAAHDPTIAAQAAELLARELLALGVNWNLAPVVDVNNNPANPVIGARSYGDDPRLVGAYAAAVIEAYQAAGILSCAKHFPGHGDTDVDSHIGLPRVNHDRQRLDAIELAPFRAAIAAEVGSVMTAHMLVPGLDPEWIGTLSAPILTDLLRRELGHDGVIVTDALEMAGVADILDEPDAAVASVIAGADVLLTGRKPELNARVFETLTRAIKSGHVPNARFEMAVRNVLNAKARYADKPPPDPARAEREVGTPEHLQQAVELARRTITVVRDTAGHLPLPRDLGSGLVVLSPLGSRRTMMETWTQGESVLGREVTRRAPGAIVIPVQYPVDADTQKSIDSAVGSARAVVVGTLNAMLDPDQVSLLEHIRDLAPQAALVVVGMRTPYDILALPWLSTYVCAYTSVDCSLIATAEVLFGETPALGRLPVRF